MSSLPFPSSFHTAFYLFHQTMWMPNTRTGKEDAKEWSKLTIITAPPASHCPMSKYSTSEFEANTKKKKERKKLHSETTSFPKNWYGSQGRPQNRSRFAWSSTASHSPIKALFGKKKTEIKKTFFSQNEEFFLLFFPFFQKHTVYERKLPPQKRF